MIDTTSGLNNSKDSAVIDRRRHLEFRCCCEESSGTHIQSVSVSSTTVIEHTGTQRNDDANDACYTPTKFGWPLGDASCQERLELQIPLRSIRNEAVQGGNVSITWSRGDESCIMNKVTKTTKLATLAIQPKLVGDGGMWTAWEK
jgi:hypothetical protein